MTVINGATGEIVTNDAWERHALIVQLRHLAERSFLDLGRELHEFHARRQWRVLGYPSLNAYLADPDVDISRSLAFRLMGIHAKYERELQVPPGGLLEAGHSKLDLMRPYMTAENVLDWVPRAATLSRSDLRLALQDELGAEGLVPEETEEPTPAEPADEVQARLLRLLTDAWEALGDRDLEAAAVAVDEALALVRRVIRGLIA